MIWIFIDRNRNKVIDFQIGDRDKWTYYKVYKRIRNNYNINYLCTDHWDAYNFYKISNIHIKSKSETSLIESVNSLIRHYLARFNRRTKRYSKSIEMIEYSLYLLFDKLYWKYVVR